MKFDQALKMILSKAPMLGRRQLPLAQSFGRVCTDNNRARLAVPCYDQSTRDGYVVSGDGRAVSTNEFAYQICGEIAAGPAKKLSITKGQAYRIMTGGFVPQGADRVIAQEHCRVLAGEVLIGPDFLSANNRYIRKHGSEHGADDLIVAPGTRLNENHIALLAAAGNTEVEVYRRPRVAFFCSGSELVITGDSLLNGQKISSNHYLLNCLITNHGGIGQNYGVVADDKEAIQDLLTHIVESGIDIVISTGGVGPGKYDLFKRILRETEAELIYDSLSVRPGRSTLFGVYREALYFGLPGPPPAVNILFHELIGPVIRKMQGMEGSENRRVLACLEHDISLKSDDVLCFSDGVYGFDDGRITVRYPGSLEMPNCFILLEPGTSLFTKNEMVPISPIETRY